MKNTTVIGLIGARLDSGKSAKRWEKWRPTVAICQQDDFVVDRFELLYEEQEEELVEVVTTDIQSVSPETAVVPHPIQLKDPWDLEEVYSALHAFAREYTFRLDSEDYFINITTGTHVEQICLYLLTESRHLPGVLLQASPAKGDPTGTFRIIDLDLSKYDRLAARFSLEQQEDLSFLKSGIETKNANFNKLIEQIERVAAHSDEPILLTGPTGAGKSQLARRIYELKRRRQRITTDFVEVNCATLRGDQAMSTLFGHVKGAFTGAQKDREGLLKSAHQGMLFLDEIGELGLDEQAMLLRAIEEKRFLPVGADKEVDSDFRLIAGTNRDLWAEVSEGKFREDLLARINLWTFSLPGLRERREDIEPNLDYELEQFATRSGNRVTFNKEARTRFLKFATSAEARCNANFRDLNAAVTRMSTLAQSGRINAELVHEEIERLKRSWSSVSKEQSSAVLEAHLSAGQLNEIDIFDRPQLAYVLGICKESKSLSAAGRTLFNVSRLKKKMPNDADRLRKYLGRFGISWADVVESD